MKPDWVEGGDVGEAPRGRVVDWGVVELWRVLVLLEVEVRTLLVLPVVRLVSCELVDVDKLSPRVAVVVVVVFEEVELERDVVDDVVELEDEVEVAARLTLAPVLSTNADLPGTTNG